MRGELTPFEGAEVHASRLAVSGTVEIDQELEYGHECVVLMRGPVTSVSHEDFRKMLTRKQSLSASEVYLIHEDDVMEVLTEQRKLAKKRADAQSGQTALDDDPDDGDEGGEPVRLGSAIDEALATADASEQEGDDDGDA